ncbi:uncharacterized protein LOC119640539 [Glossina fuscipes]|uniref:Uncharacterized protein LOC119640539 n=1 Tax=Glossina fuscipes TaxID=7396 RepID=A0A9C5Z3G2_9MUSC|nr:uncharacterized protein LOC119640539 [Glossina fuscipes]
MQNPPYKLYSCHDCNIVAAQASSILPLLVTLGEDGKIFVYDFKAKMLLLQEEFDKAGTGIIRFSGRISLSESSESSSVDESSSGGEEDTKSIDLIDKTAIRYICYL